MRQIRPDEVDFMYRKSFSNNQRLNDIQMLAGKHVIDMAFRNNIGKLPAPGFFNIMANIGMWIKIIKQVYGIILWTVDQFKNARD